MLVAGSTGCRLWAGCSLVLGSLVHLEVETLGAQGSLLRPVPLLVSPSVLCTGLCAPSLIPSFKPVGVPCGELMGVYFLRNLLFLRVSLLEPNAITL